MDRKVRLYSSCSELNRTVAVVTVKNGNLKHFADSYPQQSEVRRQKINELKAQYERSTFNLRSMFACSLRTHTFWRRDKKPFTDGNNVKEHMDAVPEILVDGKEQDKLIERNNQNPLSATTAARCMEILAQGIQSHLTAALKRAAWVAVND